MDVISLTRELLAFDNINPPGNEEGIARFAGKILSDNKFNVRLFPFSEGRLHMVAERGLTTRQAPVVFSGHFDTVPLGAKEWSVDPSGSSIDDKRLFGRGSSDMKGGLAAMIVAAVEAFNENVPCGGIRMIFSAAEELGCKGIEQLAATWADPGNASAVIVGEPTSNHPYTGHKGALYLNAKATGKTAHSSMPQLGDNAIYKIAEAILKARDFIPGKIQDPLLGLPTLNVGRMTGGMNVNSVPDKAEFSIDIRSTGTVDHNELIERLGKEFGKEIELEVLVSKGPVRTDEEHPFVKLVYKICGIGAGKDDMPKALPYLTDGSVLQLLYNGVPTIILGPGQPEMAHRTDEFIYLDKLEESVGIYRKILQEWKI